MVLKPTDNSSHQRNAEHTLMISKVRWGAFHPNKAAWPHQLVGIASSWAALTAASLGLEPDVIQVPQMCFRCSPDIRMQGEQVCRYFLQGRKSVGDEAQRWWH